MDAYAQPSDLTPDWLATPPAGAVRMLSWATVLVAKAAGRNPYTDTADRTTPLRDATCAQVAYWTNSGLTLDQLGAALVKRAEILTGKVELDTQTQAAERAEALTGLCSEAAAILEVSGLLVVPLPLFDDTGVLPTWGLDSPLDYRWPPMAEWPAWQ